MSKVPVAKCGERLGHRPHLFTRATVGPPTLRPFTRHWCAGNLNVVVARVKS